MLSLSRRSALSGLAAVGGASLVSGLLPTQARAATLDRLTLSGMPSTPSVLVARLVAAGALDGLVANPDVTIWRSPDQMRAGVLSGDLPVFGVPSYSCANLFNRGVPVRMLNILTWGLLYLVTRDDTVNEMADIAGKRLAVAFRNDAPDLILRLVLSRLGLEPGRDVHLEYVGTPTEAVQLLLAGNVDSAVVPEPAATATLARAAQQGISVRRAADLTAEYGRLTGRAPRIAQAGLGVSEELVQNHPEIVAAIHRGCVEAGQWVLANPAEAGALGEPLLEMPAAMIERSIPHFRLEVASAAEARADMEAYFTDLMELSPDIVGGRLPEASFYWGA